MFHVLHFIYHEIDSNEIDTMDNDKHHEAKAFQDKDYIMTKHIALLDETKRRRQIEVADPAPVEMSSKSITTTTSPTAIFTTLPEASKVATPSTLTTTTRHRHSSTKATKTMAAENLPATASLTSLVNHRLYANKTHLDDLSSLSLLSLQDTTLTTADSLQTTLSSALSSVAGATTTPTTSKYATALRIKGDEQTMHHTNSHLTVDNVNATIVASSNGGTSGPPHNHHQHHLHQALHSDGDSSSTIAAGHSNRSVIVVGSTSTSISNSNATTTTATARDTTDNFLTAKQNIGGEAGNNKTNSTVGSGTTRISARRVEHKHLLPKSHKTDAPMLNYIFDTFSSANKHHHHDQR